MLWNRQRRRCEQLASAVQAEREIAAQARANAITRLGEMAASPAGLGACFAAGLLLGQLVGGQRDDDGSARPGRGAGLAGKGIRAFRTLRDLGAL